MSCSWKVVFLGESSVGKSSIITRYTQGKFVKNNATIGAAFSSRKIVVDSEHEVQLEIWDTAGQERYRSLTQMYYRNTDVAVIVFDLSLEIKHSLAQVDSWIHELYRFIEEDSDNNKIHIVVVGNKFDLVKDQDRNAVEIQKYIESKRQQIMCDIRYIELSAKNGLNVINLFEQTIIELIPNDKFINSPIDLETISLQTKRTDTSNCGC
ncbi:GTP-binding protein Ypt53p [Monosporozyma servazzii]